MNTRNTYTFSIPDREKFKSQALAWAQQSDHLHFFTDNNFTPYPYGGFVERLAVGCAKICRLQPGKTFENLQQFHNTHPDWLIGYFSYDLKNEIENLNSRHPNYLDFPAAYFYIPVHIIHFQKDTILIETLEDPQVIYKQILQTQLHHVQHSKSQKFNIRSRTSKEIYLKHVNQIKAHILEGDVYELNYCIEFFSERVFIDPMQVYQALNHVSPMPFSVYQRINNCYVLCASPERFLKKTGSKLISQPIKGTARRGSTPEEDNFLKEQLRNNEKEQAENMMIVDLVRNDLARSAMTGTVKVEEIFGIYTFPQLHQMISTISAQLRPGISFTQAIKHAFPVGSMTGAPKIKALELIDQYEQARRGVYSGAIGYITPKGDFDFNVVIRSIIYNSSNRYLSFQAGSAITYDAVGEKEYEECLLKAKAMQQVLLDKDS